jgi:hypothetical protein
MSDFVRDLTVIRYLQAGLVADEACLWITASDNAREDVRRRAGKVGSPLAPFVDTPRLAVAPFREWYFPNGHFDAGRVTDRLAAQVDAARREGSLGLRVFCETTWTTERELDDLAAYECSVGSTVMDLPMILTCAYSGERVSRDALARLLHGHTGSLTVSESPITFHFTNNRQGDVDLVTNKT